MKNAKMFNRNCNTAIDHIERSIHGQDNDDADQANDHDDDVEHTLRKYEKRLQHR